MFRDRICGAESKCPDSFNRIPLHQHKTQVDTGSPEQYCTLMDGLVDGTPLCVSTYPVAWRIEVAKEEEYSGYEYVRSGRASLKVQTGFADTTS